MCNYSNTKPKLHIAKKDIVVYKYVRFSYWKWCNKIACKSLIYPSLYIKNLVKKSALDKPLYIGNLCIYNTYKYCSGRGLYSYVYKNPDVNAEFVIPKGANYYKYDGVYVSDKIIYKGRL